MAKVPFERVVERHGVTVLRVCRAILGAQDAEDAWAEAFLAALRAYPDLPEGANVEAWLVRIAHNKCIDALRASGRRAVPAGSGVEVGELVPHGGGRASGTLPADEYDAVVAAVAGLPEKQRLAVAYHHLVGLPYAEVAELLGGSEAASRRAAADGMKTLRRVLA